MMNPRMPDAFARVVDRLLASPAYGERWGRHWLDVARYADSNGLDENLVFTNAWRYRDYVIRSFNADRPIDRFIQEQLAGDLLPPGPGEEEGFDRIVATGFLALGAKMLAEDDPVKQTNRRGMVSFAMGGPNTRTTQLFINYGNNANLDAMGFAPIGEVTEGMEVVDSLYANYGEGAPDGSGPDQGRIMAEGNAYLNAGFPRLDFIRRARVVP